MYPQNFPPPVFGSRLGAYCVPVAGIPCTPVVTSPGSGSGTGLAAPVIPKEHGSPPQADTKNSNDNNMKRMTAMMSRSTWFVHPRTRRKAVVPSLCMSPNMNTLSITEQQWIAWTVWSLITLMGAVLAVWIIGVDSGLLLGWIVGVIVAAGLMAFGKR